LPEVCELAVQEFEAGFERLTVARVRAGSDLIEHAGALELEAVTFALDFQLFGREAGTALIRKLARGLDLLFYGFAFPSARHTSS
jgi:hypothetical protein